jgi:hypothetical protein
VFERLAVRKPTERLSSVVGDLFDKIIATNVVASAGIGTDNMTAVVIQFTG